MLGRKHLHPAAYEAVSGVRGVALGRGGLIADPRQGRQQAKAAPLAEDAVRLHRPAMRAASSWHIAKPSPIPP